MHTRISYDIYIYIYIYVYIYITYHFLYIICIYLYNVANDRRCIYVHLVTVPNPRTIITNGKVREYRAKSYKIVELHFRVALIRVVSTYQKYFTVESLQPKECQKLDKIYDR